MHPIKQTCCLFTALCVSLSMQAQDRPTTPPGVGTPPVATPPRTAPKPYKEVITDKARTTKGFFTIHKIDDRYFAEIPLKMLGRDLLVLNRVSKSSVESPKAFGGYAGDQIGDNVIRFENGPNNKVFVRNISYSVNPDSTKQMYRSVLNSNIQPIALAFDVKAYAPDSLGEVS